LPAGASVAWSATPAGTVSLQPNGSSVTVTKKPKISGDFSLTAAITDACNTSPIIVSRNLVAGAYPITISGPYNMQHFIDGVVCAGKQYYFMVNDSETGQSYTWTLSPPVGSSNLPTLYAGSTVYIPFNNETGNYTLQVSKTNSCGTAFDGMTINVQECMNGMIASPNPATSTLNITIADDEQPTDLNNASATISGKTMLSSQTSTGNAKITDKTKETTGKTTMYLYDFYTGQLVKTWRYDENSLKTYSLNVAGIKRGVYTLKMERDHKTSVTKVILQ
jgi:hypothetical protein